MENILEYLEISIVEYCNLNCKGCSHFSPLANSDDFVELDEFKRDVVRIAELLPHIYKIRLLGGEPLMHPNLNEVIEFTRQWYPYSEIHIVTNGLLLLKREKDLENWVKNRVCIDISLYPPTMKIKKDIEKLLTQYKIEFKFTDPITEFRRRMDLSGSGNVEEAYMNCMIGKNCKYLYRGKISGCPAPNVVKLFDRTYGYNLSCESDMIDIYSINLTTSELIKKLHEPLETCKYCGVLETFPWENSVNGHKKEDWLVTGESNA